MDLFYPALFFYQGVFQLLSIFLLFSIDFIYYRQTVKNLITYGFPVSYYFDIGTGALTPYV